MVRSPLSELRRTLRPLLGATLAIVLVLTSACSENSPRSSESGERGLTASEAEALAVMRFQNYRDGVLSGQVELASARGMTATVAVDLRAHVGLGVITSGSPSGQSASASSDAAPALFAWNGQQVRSAMSEGGDPFAGALPSPREWAGAALNPSTPVDNFLLLLLQLGSDRPENPQLLRQSSARYLRSTTLDGVPVTVFAGPTPSGADSGESRTRYWLDEDGMMRRFELAVGQGDYDRFTVEERPAPALPRVITRLFLGSEAS